MLWHSLIFTMNKKTPHSKSQASRSEKTGNYFQETFGKKTPKKSGRKPVGRSAPKDTHNPEERRGKNAYSNPSERYPKTRNYRKSDIDENQEYPNRGAHGSKKSDFRKNASEDRTYSKKSTEKPFNKNKFKAKPGVDSRPFPSRSGTHNEKDNGGPRKLRRYTDLENPHEKAYSATGFAGRKGKSFNPNHARNIAPDRSLEEQMPLNKYIAHCGICSRRDAVSLIKEGKVQVNGAVQLEPGYKISNRDQVTLNGKKIDIQKNLVYILLNKPKGYITTTDDPKGRRTVLDILSGQIEERVFPVGRLDRNTTGLLLLTNDGALAQKLSHPKYNMRKVYQVTLDRNLEPGDYARIKQGVVLEDGKAEVDALEYLGEANQLGLEIHSGKNRIVRRIFESVGYTVEKLDRVMYAGLTKKNVLRGKWRFLTPQEVINLKHLH